MPWNTTRVCVFSQSVRPNWFKFNVEDPHTYKNTSVHPKKVFVKLKFVLILFYFIFLLFLFIYYWILFSSLCFFFLSKIPFIGQNPTYFFIVFSFSKLSLAKSHNAYKCLSNFYFKTNYLFYF